MVSAFRIGSVFAWAALVTFVALTRGRLYAMFVGVVLGVHTMISLAIADRFGVALPFAAYAQTAVYVHFALLVRSRLRPNWYRALVSLPASGFSAGTMMALPWAVCAPFFDLPGIFVPFGVAAIGMIQSLTTRRRTVTVALDDADLGELARVPSASLRVDRPLRLVQISDPHLGPFMSEARLRAIVERAVEAEPDLILLTGDLLTMESHRAPDALSRALAPLAALHGRVFACRGNHDFEAVETIGNALAAAGVKYLIDDSAVIETAAGPVQIVGLDFTRKERGARMRKVLETHARLPGHFRLVLLHDPGAFHHIPDADADLVLSGHTHGGQLGLVSLGAPATIVSLLTKIPDHGLWAKGKNRLYVHRGTGHYGFPLRVGVPGEEGVLEVHFDHVMARSA